MGEIKGYFIIDRQEKTAPVDGRYGSKDIDPNSAHLLVQEFLTLVWGNIISVGGHGKIELIHMPGVGISLDMRAYQCSMLSDQKRAFISKQTSVLESQTVVVDTNEPLSTQISLTFQVNGT